MIGPIHAIRRIGERIGAEPIVSLDEGPAGGEVAIEIAVAGSERGQHKPQDEHGDDEARVEEGPGSASPIGGNAQGSRRQGDTRTSAFHCHVRLVGRRWNGFTRWVHDWNPASRALGNPPRSRAHSKEATGGCRYCTLSKYVC